MQSPEAGCPFHSSDTEEGKENIYMAHADLLEETSQKILDEPESTRAHLDELEATLRVIYAEMLVHQPAKAELAIVRKLRAAVRGPLGALVYSHLLVHLDSYTEEELSKKARMSDYFPLDFSDLYINADYQHTSSSWMQVMYGLMDDAMTTARHDDPKSSNTFKNIEEQSSYIWPRLAKAHKEAGSDSPIDWSKRNLLLDLVQSTTENITVALDTIRAGHIAITEALGDDTPSEDGIAEILYNNIDQLGWAASTNREAIAKILPAANGHEKPIVVGSDDKSDMERLQNVFRFENGTLIPTHPSLKKGEWRWPGNCAGRWKHRLPDEQLVAKTKGHFVHVGHPELFPEDEVNFQAIKALMAAGIAVGRHTILASEDTENQKHLLWRRRVMTL